MAKDDKNKSEDQADRQQEVFLREVDEAVRQDHLKSFASRYGVWIGLAVIIGLGSLGGWIIYQNKQGEDAGLRSEQYVAAIDKISKKDLDGADKALGALVGSKQDGYNAAAQLMQANIALEKNDPKKAISGYAKIAADEKLPQPFRDLALIRQTAAEFDSLQPQQVIDRLKKLAVPGNAWFGSAGEMVAISYLNMKKDDLAGPLLAQLAKDEGVPATIRSRALQMAGVQGIDAVELDSGDESGKLLSGPAAAEGASEQ